MKRLAIMLTAVALTACEEKIKPSVLTTVDSRSVPQQESWKSEIVISDSGMVRAVIHSGYFKVYATSRMTHLSDSVHVQFYDPDGRPTTVLTSREAAIDEVTNNLEARQQVVVTSETGTKLYTEELYWDQKRQLIHTPAFVRILSTKERLQGMGMESDQNLKNYRIFRATGETTGQ
ncbi:MAG: LPS export ABC transporter periplasmic protein LptC [Bacteroidetes bacterium]|nr:LPS export ABC transporter periplasmic protein LptC [Bacteroidota bacterium]